MVRSSRGSKWKGRLILDNNYIVCAKCSGTLRLGGNRDAEGIRHARYMICAVCNEPRGISFWNKAHTFAGSHGIGDIGITRAPLRGVA